MITKAELVFFAIEVLTLFFFTLINHRYVQVIYDKLEKIEKENKERGKL